MELDDIEMNTTRSNDEIAYENLKTTTEKSATESQSKKIEEEPYETLKYGDSDKRNIETGNVITVKRLKYVIYVLIVLISVLYITVITLVIVLFVPKTPAHGGWSQWEDWGECSATCGVGMRSRKRSCTNPRPRRFGDHCFGNSIEDELCNKGSCAVDGGWTEWNQWGQCPVSCGVELQSRTRVCTNPSPANAGKHCAGQNFDVKLCYRGICDEDCYAIKKRRGKLQSGLYDVRLWSTDRVIPVHCDFDTDTGGWTVFQYRFNGSVDFYRNFSDYERGFGSLDGEFWLGLENMYEMVSKGKTELRLDLTAADGTSVYETFQNFRLGETPFYTLHIDKGVGTAGDEQGLSYNNKFKFSTFDLDRDGSNDNCAVLDRGGWWFNMCAYANLNGEYVTPGTKRSGRAESGMTYRSFKGTESLKISKMMFRRV